MNHEPMVTQGYILYRYNSIGGSFILVHFVDISDD